MCKVGEMDVKIMFVIRSFLSWLELWFGYFLLLEYVIMGVGLFLLMLLFINKLGLLDRIILIIGFFFNVSKFIFLSFSIKLWMILVFVGIGFFIGMIGVFLCFLLSKIVSEDEVGKMFVILLSGEIIVKFLGIIVFVNIYSEIVYIFCGMVFLIEVFLFFFIFVVVVLIVFN